MNERIAVVLFNLGGPDAPSAIAPFLKNFFMDPAIIGAPYPVRFLLSRLIAWRRSRNEAGSSYAMLGGRSPILEHTRAQAQALEALLVDLPGVHVSVHVCMRYWHPMSDQVAAQVKQSGATRVILLPLYPQFSTTTTGSSFTDWDRAAKAVGLDVPTQAICCYHDDAAWIGASARLVRAAYDQAVRASGAAPRVLFSAHGLPEKIIRAGDPYQSQCEETAAAIAHALAIPNLDWQICYQSKVGPLRWIGPATDEAITQAGREGKAVVIYPHAFVSDHVETLVEIEHEYRDLAAKAGVPHFTRVPTVMTDPEFMGGLARIVRDQVLTPRGDRGTIASARGDCRCRAETHGRCPMRVKGA
jgi:ferrochelatase